MWMWLSIWMVGIKLAKQSSLGTQTHCDQSNTTVPWHHVPNKHKHSKHGWLRFPVVAMMLLWQWWPLHTGCQSTYSAPWCKIFVPKGMTEINPKKNARPQLGRHFGFCVCMRWVFWICLVFDLEDLDETTNSSVITHNFHASNSECMGGMLRSLHPTQLVWTLDTRIYRMIDLFEHLTQLFYYAFCIMCSLGFHKSDLKGQIKNRALRTAAAILALDATLVGGACWPFLPMPQNETS